MPLTRPPLPLSGITLGFPFCPSNQTPANNPHRTPTDTRAWRSIFFRHRLIQDPTHIPTASTNLRPPSLHHHEPTCEPRSPREQQTAGGIRKIQNRPIFQFAHRGEERPIRCFPDLCRSSSDLLRSRLRSSATSSTAFARLAGLSNPPALSEIPRQRHGRTDPPSPSGHIVEASRPFP